MYLAINSKRIKNEMDALKNVHIDRFIWLLNSSLLSLLVTFCALRAKFYRPLSSSEYLAAPKLSDLLFVFFVFFAIQLIAIPLLAFFCIFLLEGSWSTPQLSSENHVQVQAAALWISCVAMWALCFLFKPTALSSVNGSEEVESLIGKLYQLSFGAMTWLICFPFVLTLNQALVLVVDYFFHPDISEQVAIKYLKLSSSNPFSLVIYFLGVVLAVPVMEEFLFRGILQRWLSSQMGPRKGIMLASLMFTAMHYAGEQGFSNFVLLPCLFLLSCYLGYLYERQRSLWAPIGLHAMFNLVSALVLLYWV